MECVGQHRVNEVDCANGTGSMQTLEHSADAFGTRTLDGRVAARMNVTLRQATRADIPGINDVRYAVRENTAPRGIIPDEAVRSQIEDTGRGWVVDVDGKVVGFAIGNATDGNIWALFVHPDHEGRGYGRELHATMVDWLWSRGLATLWLTTGPGTRAQRFYERSGWRVVGPAPKGEIRLELDRS